MSNHVHVYLESIDDVARYGHQAASETVHANGKTKSHVVIPGQTEVWAEKKYVPPAAEVVNGQPVYDGWDPINEMRLTRAGEKIFNG